jgi:uncharacterized protein HemX
MSIYRIKRFSYSKVLGVGALGAGLGALNGAVEPIKEKDDKIRKEKRKENILVNALGGAVLGLGAGSIAKYLDSKAMKKTKEETKKTIDNARKEVTQRRSKEKERILKKAKKNIENMKNKKTRHASRRVFVLDLIYYTYR